MGEINSEILSLIDEAVIIARGDRIELANAAAGSLLGGDPTGKRLSAVLGSEIAAVQAADYTANVYTAGKNCLLRASKRGSRTTFVLREEARDSELINDAFISSMRDSLNTLIAAADRCRASDSAENDPALRETLASLTKNIHVTSRLVSNLSYARNILADNLEFFPRLTALTEFCRESVSQLQSMLHIELSMEGPSPLVCVVDTDHFTALLSNLVANAVYHGKADRIAVRLTESGDSVILAVTDNGKGIPCEKLGNVFERYRAPFGLAEMYGGTGLGLTVVRGIAAKHGGTVLLESREEHGTAVRVSLRKNPAGVSLRSVVETAPDTRKLLVGLSECLSEKFFASEYMD